MQPELAGPYDETTYGKCACHDQPVNAFGRCEPLNDETSPPDPQPKE